MKPAPLALALLLLAPAAVRAAPIQDGRYSDVCFDPSNGYYTGVEVTLRGGTAVLKVCQSNCWQEPIENLAVSGDAITFLAYDEARDASGAVVDRRVHRFAGRLRKDALFIGFDGAWEPEVLKLQKDDAAVAHPDHPDWPAPVRRCS